MTMPSITKTGQDRWLARYRFEGKQYARRFRSEKEAKDWIRRMTSDDVQGVFVKPDRSKVPVDYVAKAWLENPRWKESTRARNQSIYDFHISPRWGKTSIRAVEYEGVQQWVNELSESMAPASVNKVVGALRGIMAVAVKSRRIAVNPVKDVNLPRPSMKPRRYLTADQVEALAEASDGRELIIYVLAYCGLRFGELAALTVGSVDLTRRRFRVERSVTEVNGTLVHSTPKDHQRRSVPFPKFLLEDLVELTAGRDHAEPLFQAPGGGYLRVRNMRRDWFDLAVLDAGLDGVTPHVLRHTAASLAISAGATPLGVQRMLGHEKASMTLDTYSDLFDADLDDVSEKLGSIRDLAREIKLRSNG